MSKLENVPFDELEVGRKETYQKTVSEEDIVLFARVSGDVNPVHLDAEFAKTTMFGERIAHGMFTAGLISAALAMKMPGPGSIYLGQTLKFRAPVKIGDTLTVHIECTGKRDEKAIATFSTTVKNQDDKVVVTGEATALVPRDKVIVDAAPMPDIRIV